MAQELQPGEHVSWSYGAGQAKGQVVEKLTENKKLGARVFKASPDEPKYLVKSDTSGKEAIKKPETLHKLDEPDMDVDDKSSSPKESAEGRAEEPTKDGHTESDASRQEVGAKEKRDGFKQRSSKKEEKEGEPEESESKVADSGKGSARESARAAKGKIKEVAEVLRESGVTLDEGERKDKSFQPRKGELETAEEDGEGPVNLPEVIAEVKEEKKEELENNEAVEDVSSAEDEDEAVDDGSDAEDKENRPSTKAE